MTVDAIANVAVAASSAVIAAVALYFTYLQVVGRKPVAFIERGTLGGVPGTSRFKIQLVVEFWNRRPHPVVLKDFSIRTSGFEPTSALRPSDRTENEITWVGDYGWRTLDQSVEPASRLTRQIEVQFECENPAGLKATLSTRMRYYDPLTNRKSSVEIVSRFMHPGLGWKDGAGHDQRNALDASVIRGALQEQREFDYKGPGRTTAPADDA